MPTLICDCNKTMPLDARALGQALHEDLTLHSTLCRREAGAFRQALQGGQEVVVACTQEKRLFTELAGLDAPDAAPGALPPGYAPLRFVNIRETGGWSRDASEATPKIAALLAAARLPEPDPVATVTYRSEGRLLIIGPLEAGERIAAGLADTLAVTLFAQGGVGAQERRHPVLAGRIASLEGWLGAFRLAWAQDNPIDLDLCTRCNECIRVCPEGAIGFDYQVNLDACTSHRDCVRACDAAGAIDFAREPRSHQDVFDLVLDLRPQPAFLRHALPQGYFHLPGGGGDGALSTLMQLRELVGEFEKPKFVSYRQKLCAHSRNEQVGCRACIDICSAEAITSHPARQQVQVNANLCVGCGACTTVCPTGALTYASPRPDEQGLRLRTLLTTHAQAGGTAATLLLHGRARGAELIDELGRSARVGAAHGVPASVIPVGLWHAASTGLELWLGAFAWGAARVIVLVTADDAPQYVDALTQQMAVAEAVLQGLGYTGTHFAVMRCAHPQDLDQELQLLQRQPAAATVPQPARFQAVQDKRATLELALDHLIEQAGRRPDAIALPAGAPLGTVVVDKDRCTLCLSCVSACPASALLDNPEQPQLRFIEKNCVQCGLCARTCPEDAITLQTRLLITPERRQPQVVNAMPPYACVRCGKPFGTLKAIEAMITRLSGHAMFQGAALERLKMCGDCRVIDLHSSENEARITDP